MQNQIYIYPLPNQASEEKPELGVQYLTKLSTGSLITLQTASTVGYCLYQSCTGRRAVLRPLHNKY